MRLLLGLASVFAATVVFAADVMLVENDGLTTKALQSAINTAAARGGGIVRLSPGRHICDGITLRSNVTLEVPENCTLVATTNLAAYAHRGAFIFAEGQTNVTIVGGGTIDGSGASFVVRDNAPGRPRLMRFYRCRDLRIEGVTLRQPAMWTCYFHECENVTARRVHMFGHANYNNDGFDIEAKNVLIEDCDIDTDDDAVCFKSDNPDFTVGNCKVRNCRISSNCSAIKFGTPGHGTYRDIFIHDCEVTARTKSHIRDWHRPGRTPGGVADVASGISAISLEVVDGGVMDGVTIRDIRVSGMQTPIFIRQGMRHDHGCVSELKNVLIENITGSCVGRVASSITGIPGRNRRPHGITLRNIDLTMPGGSTEADAVRPVPERIRNYPEAKMFGCVLPAWGFYIRHADGIKFENVNLHLASADARAHAVVLDDASSVSVENCSFTPHVVSGEDLTRWADPFIGTAGTANCFPNATVPHGLVQAGPTSGTGAWKYCGGYQFEDRELYGFVQDAISGTGCLDLGDIRIQPFVGDGENAQKTAVKGEEAAWPGYYTVRYPKQGICTEVTATPHVGFYRFEFGVRSSPRMLVDLQWGHTKGGNLFTNHVLSCETAFPDASTMTGHCRVKHWVERDYYFAIRFSRPVAGRSRAPNDSPGEKGERHVLDFDKGKGRQMLVKVALSSTSVKAALDNMQNEVPHWDFDRIEREARQSWQRIFTRFSIEGSEEQKTSFYTAVYHLGIAPNNIADAGKPPFYSTLSCWDTFRAAHPMFTLLEPECVDDFVTSCFRYYDRNGFLPVWALWGEDNQCMIGTHSVPFIVDAYLKGFRRFDVQKAWESIRDSLRNNHPKRRKDKWNLIDEYGYYPFDVIRGESVSRLLECGYDDWCAAEMAKALGGRDEDEAYFRARSMCYTNVFDKSTLLMRGRNRAGAWRDPFDPLEYGHGGNVPNDYTEGNAWQYTWHVLQDPDGLVRLFGGKERFANRLDTLFSQASTLRGHVTPDVSGMIGQYVHGNEPSHHVIYLYQYAHRPERTEELVREVCDKFYRTGPWGLSGNDDCGQMSAWYLFSAMGFYPVNPCGGDYVIGAPQLERVALCVGNGNDTNDDCHNCSQIANENLNSQLTTYNSTRSTCSTRLKTFTVIAKNLSKENKYVKSVTLNGRPLNGFIVRHADIVAGGNLVFEMCARPEPPRPRVGEIAIGSSASAELKAGGWNPSVRERLEKLIERNRGRSDAYAVFDFDYTTAIGDLSYTCMWYLIEKFAFKTADFRSVFTEGVPPKFMAEANMLASLAASLMPFAGDDVSKRSAWREFVVQYWKLYRSLFREVGEQKAILWRVRMFIGYTPEDMKSLAKAAISENLKRCGIYRDSLVPTEKRGLVFAPEIKELFAALHEAGIAVYIVSGSPRQMLLAATGRDFGFCVDPENVFGVDLVLDADGRYKAEVVEDSSVKAGLKAEFIRKYISPRHHGTEPVLTAGDSIGDYSMLTDFKTLQIALVFGRNWKEREMHDLAESGGNVLVQWRDESSGRFIQSSDPLP